MNGLHQNGDTHAVDRETYIEAVTSTYINQASLQRDPQKFYDGWAKKYDDDMLSENYEGRIEMAKLIRQYFSPNERLIDIAAGTGMVGAQVAPEYRNLDALDGSSQMLEVAKQKNIYKNLIHRFMDHENPTDIRSDTYDGAWILGCVGPGHMGPENFEEVFRIIKPRGILVLGLNGNYERRVIDPDRRFDVDMKEVLRGWEKEGRIKILDRSVRPYYGKLHGVYYILKVLKKSA